MARSESITVQVDGIDVTVSNPGKVFFPQRGETKLDLIEYYRAVSGPFLEWIRGRPVMMERYPNSAGGKSWWQKRVPANTPEWVRTTEVSTPNGTKSDALVVQDMAHIVWAVNLGCLGFHVWPFHADHPEYADELRVDLDPSPGTGYREVKQAARLARDLLGELGIRANVKTSGSRGLHIYIPLLPRWDSYQVRSAAVAFARMLEKRHPDLITAQWWKEERGARVFVDYNQNAPHKTVFGAWCVRPRVGAQVSTPLEWDELDDLEPDELTISTVPALVEQRGDPWADAARRPQSIEPLLQQYQKDLADGMMDAPWPPVYPKMPNEPPRVAPSRAKKR